MLDSMLLKAHLRVPCLLSLYDAVDSTNDMLKHAESSNDSNTFPEAVVAGLQSAGRGRLGRSWTSPPGGVYVSLKFRTRATPLQSSALSLVSALATRHALCTSLWEDTEICSGIGIKWPNDIVSESGKIAGILVESTAASSRDTQVIIGIGVNVIRPVEGADERAVYLSDLQPGAASCPSREIVAAYLINEICFSMRQWEQGSFSFEPFREAYENALTHMNEEVVVRSIDGSIVAQGVVQGVDSVGQLLVQGSTVVAVYAGEVTLREMPN